MKTEFKKVLVIFGSPHYDGNTAGLLNSLMSVLKIENDYKIINAYELNANPCIDCGFCKTDEKCRYKDLDELDFLLKECDLIIFASPIYNYSFPAPLKAIIDRMQRYYNAKINLKTNPFINKEKRGIILLTQGSSALNSDIISAQINPILKLLNIKKTEYLILDNTDNKKIDIDKFFLKSENKIRSIMSFLNKK